MHPRRLGDRGDPGFQGLLQVQVSFEPDAAEQLDPVPGGCSLTWWTPPWPGGAAVKTTRSDRLGVEIDGRRVEAFLRR